MRYSVFLLVLITSVLVFLSFSWPEPTTQPDPSALYKQYCAQCHGQDLKGGNAQSMVDGIWQFGDGESYIFRNIKFGIPDLGMPSFEASLSDEQISSLVTYITNLEKEAGVDKPDFSEKLETQEYIMKMEVYAENLNIPWSIDFIDDETALITERPGNLYVVHQGSRNQNPVRNTPKVLHEGQGGLMDVAVDPQYEENGWIYLSYSHILDSKEERPPAMTRIVRGKIEDNKWSDEQVLYEAEHDHYSTMRHHYGSRIVFDPQGYLYFSVGDRGAREQAQELSRPNGKIHRINKDGSIPADNPFVDTQGALPTIFTYGNRNTQGMAVHPETGEVWTTEHGPMGGDELNLLEAGENYGWPVITYGKNYDGTIITEQTTHEGMEQPNYYWTPSIAVCGLDFYHGGQFPKWNNRLLVGALKYEEVQLLHIVNDRVIHSQTILKNFGRVRDVETGPDGAIYVVLNSPGRVIKLSLDKAK